MSDSMWSRRQILLAYALAVVLTTGIFIRQVWSGHRQQVLDARSTAENIAWVLQQGLDASLRRTDATVEELVGSVREESLRPELRARFETALNRTLASQRVKFPEIAAFRIVAADGQLLYTSDPVANFANLSDRAYFREMRDKPDAGLVYSEVLLSRLTGQTVIVVGRAIRDRAGRFIGACTAVLNLDSYSRQFDSIDLGPKGAIAIHYLDGSLALRRPVQAASAERTSSPIQALVAAGGSEGSLLYTESGDGIERMVAFRRVPVYPFYVTVGVASDDFLAVWRSQSAVNAGVSLAALLVFSALLLSVSRARAREAGNARLVEERELNLQYVLEATGEGIWDWDLTSGRVRVNARFCEIFGIAKQRFEFGALELSRYGFHEDAAIFRQAMRACLKAQATLHLDCRSRSDRGDIVWILIRGNVVERDASGRALRVVGSIADIGGRKSVEAQLRDAVAAAEGANVAKSSFLATMSHEIRTPLNGVLGMAQLLLLPGLGEEERQEYARTILHSGRSLLAILNDILDLSKIEAGKLELMRAPMQPHQLIRETAALFSESARAKGLSVEAVWSGQMDQRYRGDVIRLGQMLANLLSNAIKFTAQGYVRLEARELERTGDEALLEFAVTDSGIGVAPEQQVDLFKPFSQADGSITRNYGGTGLGLSIVRRLARLMGGEVGLSSEAGKGSCFWFRIRVDVMAAGEESRCAERGASLGRKMAASDGSRRRVLVVEDNATNRMVIEALLRKLGIETECVDNGQVAVDVITGGARPDLVLMDCQMPVMDGYEATRRIRRWEDEQAGSRLPIIALTAGAFDDERDRCIESGMDDYLAKPIAFEKLTELLLRRLGVRP